MEKRSASNNKNKTSLFQILSRREQAQALVFLAAILAGAWLPRRIIISTSPSLQHRVFFLTSVNIKKIKNGDYLVFRHTDTTFVHKGLNGDNDRLTKKVGCSPGETLTKDAEGQFFCGHQLLGKALRTDSQGRQLPSFQFLGLVPGNNYFMLGSNPRSFDSRYFGFVHADDILYKALPLW